MDSKVLDYWRQCSSVYSLMHIQPLAIKDAWRIITQQECDQGKIVDHAALESLFMRGNVMVIAPEYAYNNGKYFIPYYLLAELNPAGKLIAKPMRALPVVPKVVLEIAMLDPIVIGSAEQFDHYLAINPPVWQEDPELLTWQAQIAYAKQMLSDVTNNLWQQDLLQLGYVIRSDALIFPLSDIVKHKDMSIELLQNYKMVELVDAQRNSGKSDYAYSLIVDAWMEAAVKKAPPPQYVWVQHNERPRYASLNIDFQQNQSDILDTVHAELHNKFNAYIKGKQCLRNWQEMNKRLNDAYAEYSGIKARQKQLEESLSNARAHHRHLQVLYSIWLRQAEMVTSWKSAFDFVPTYKRRRLQRLHKFFKENFPQEDVSRLNQAQMEQNLLDKTKRAESSERCAADALHQVENDMQQEALVRARLEQWERQYQTNIASNKMFNELTKLSNRYWAAFFRRFSEYDDYSLRDPDSIEVLIVEHAEQMLPMHACSLLAISKRAVIMGTFEYTLSPAFATQIDFEIARAYELATDDNDFEDLQFNGIAGSVGNLWALATQDREADRFLKCHMHRDLDYQLIDTRGTSQSYLGSRVNVTEIEQIITWLRNNYTAGQSAQIYTCFSAQRHCLKDSLSDAGFEHIPVYLLQDYPFAKADFTIFTSVYTADDSGPYNFDRGAELLGNLTANTNKKLLLIGDRRIFKPQLHSAAGKFAKLFLTKETQSV